MLEFARVIGPTGKITIPSRIWKLLKCDEDEQSFEVIVEYGELCIKKYDRNQDITKKPFTGIVRYTDKTHRICIPAEYCNILNMQRGDDIIVTLDRKGKIHITKAR